MKTTQTQQWLYLLTFTAAGIVAFGIVYAAAVLFIPPAKDVREYYAGVVGFTEKYIGQKPLVLPPAGEVYKDFFALKTNETVAIDNYQIIYRGPESKNSFILEIADTRLDVETFYTRRFDSGGTYEGIRIGNRHYRVLAARPTILHLQRIAN